MRVHTGIGRPVVTGVVLLICMANGSAEAQRVSLGPRIGINLSTVKFEDPNMDAQQAIRGGFHIGVSAGVELNRHVSVETSLLYGQGGFDGLGGMPGDLATDYLAVPVLARLRIPARVSPYLAAGLAPRLQVRCRLTAVALVDTTSCDDPLVGSEWRTFDLGALVGLGFDVSIGDRTLTLGGLLDLGLTDPKAASLPPGRARNLGLWISSAFLVPIR